MVPLAALVVVFVASRLAIAFAGVRFDASTLGWFWHYLDPELLRNDLAESLLYLHAQPPLFNLLLGIALKVAPEHWAEVLHGVFLTSSAAGALGGYLLLLGLGLSRPAGAAIIAVGRVSPAWLLYENWLFYEHLVAMALILSGLALHRYLTSPSVGRSLVFFTLVAGVVLTRSLFHPVWLVLVLAIVVLADLGAWRRTAIGAAAPYAVVALVIVKNLVLFGVPGTTSWDRLEPRKGHGRGHPGGGAPGARGSRRPLTRLARSPVQLHRGVRRRGRSAAGDGHRRARWASQAAHRSAERQPPEHDRRLRSLPG